MLDRVLNLDLLKSPLNWLTLVLMVMIGALAVDVLVRAQRSLSHRLGSAVAVEQA